MLDGPGGGNFGLRVDGFADDARRRVTLTIFEPFALANKSLGTVNSRLDHPFGLARYDDSPTVNCTSRWVVFNHHMVAARAGPLLKNASNPPAAPELEPDEPPGGRLTAMAFQTGQECAQAFRSLLAPCNRVGGHIRKMGRLRGLMLPFRYRR